MTLCTAVHTAVRVPARPVRKGTIACIFQGLRFRYKDSVLKAWVRHAPQALTWLLRAFAVAAAIWALGRLLQIVPARMSYPGELEWMEGGVLEHARRIARGLPLYVEPSPEFTPFLYTPFYYWLCAGFGFIFGLDVGLLRAVSFASFLGSTLVLAFWTGKRTRHFYLGVIGGGVFAATFRLGGAWFDIARGDSLLVFFLLLGGLLLLEYRCTKSAVAAACIFSCAFLTKQSAIVPAATLICWAVLVRSRRTLLFAGVLAGLLVTSIALLHVTSSGWSTYYIFILPSRHPLLEEWKLLFWKNDVLGALAIPALVLLMLLVREVERAEEKCLGFGLTAFSAGIVGMVWSSRFHLGMYDNVLMPLHALGALGIALTLANLTGKDARNYSLEWATLIGATAFIWKLEYPLEKEVPTEAHIKQYERLVSDLKKLPPGTWVAYHAVPALDAGFQPRGHWMGMIDVIRGGSTEAAKLTAHSREWLKSHKAPAIVWSIDDPSTAWFTQEMRRYYRRSGRVFGPAPLTGWGQAAREVWVPRVHPTPTRPRSHSRAAPAN